MLFHLAEMYYPDISDEWFKNHIICSPQVVFDSISQLIVASLRTLHSEGPVIEVERRNLIKKGQFSIESIEKYCCCDTIAEKLKKQELIPVTQLVELLKYINLLSPIVHSKPDGSKQITYLLPAVLDCASPDELNTPTSPDDNSPGSLLITFSCGYVPTGSFCGLITRLVSLGPKKILGLTWELAEEGIKRNCVSFHVATSNTVTLISHEKCYEVRVTLKHDRMSLHQLCSYVLSVIFYTLKNLYQHLVPQVSFQCSCPNHNFSRSINHSCTLTDEFWVRFFCGSEPIDLRRDQQFWLGEVGFCLYTTVYWGN